jgi:hypothetical protein
VHRQTDLLEVVRALGPPSRFPRGLNGRQQQANEDGDDADHHKQLDQGKTAVSSSHGLCLEQNEMATGQLLQLNGWISPGATANDYLFAPG